MPNQRGWSEFFQANRTRGIRPTLFDAASRCEAEAGEKRELFAIDLGCGSGADTRALLERGWRVLAIDAEQEAIEILLGDVDAEHTSRLQTLVSPYRNAQLPDCDLLHAGFSLPFCNPNDFPKLWQKVRSGLRPGARFAGQFFGRRDTWSSNPNLNFQTMGSVAELLGGLSVEECREDEGPGDSFAGAKYWHVIHVIAQRPREDP